MFERCHDRACPTCDKDLERDNIYKDTQIHLIQAGLKEFISTSHFFTAIHLNGVHWVVNTCSAEGAAILYFEVLLITLYLRELYNDIFCLPSS